MKPTDQEHQMFPLKTTGEFSKTAAFSAVLLLAGCGGGSEPATEDAAYLEAVHEHDAGQQAAPAPAPDAAATVAAEAPSSEAPSYLATAGLSALVSTESIKLATAYTPLVQGTINAAPYWPAWTGNGKPIDGVACFINGQIHRHSLISIYKDGKRLGFPTAVGRPLHGCNHAYELHTHDVTGIIHMETDVAKTFKLGQWFSLWGQPLNRNGTAGLAGPVRFYVIDNERITRYDGNPYDIQMLPHREILIVTGTEMTVVPKYKWPAI
jgi:hypothetical protein